MSLNLSKGGGLNLTKAAPKVSEFAVGLSWETDADADVSAFQLDNTSGRPILIGEDGVIFYNQKVSGDGSIVHSGDSRSGGTAMGGGDDETILVDLSKAGPNVNEISFIVTIAGAPANGQTFGQVSNAKIRIYDSNTGDEFAHYNLDADTDPTSTAVHFGSLVKNGGDWSFEAVGDGFPGKDLEAFIHFYGPDVKTVGHG